MSLGMGVPLLLIGLGAGRFMQNQVDWMEGVTKFFWNSNVRCCYLAFK